MIFPDSYHVQVLSASMHNITVMKSEIPKFRDLTFNWSQTHNHTGENCVHSKDGRFGLSPIANSVKAQPVTVCLVSFSASRGAGGSSPMLHISVALQTNMLGPK